uniref:NR LBD domain-containing protein n=1 Tax=Panagrolaimus sp. JU765 TaxID=591449 RepID=A0AC34R810_9BILA
DLAVDITKAGVYIDGMDPHKLEELMKFCFPLKQGISEMIEMPIKQLQLSQFEICYVVGLIIFSAHDVRGLTNQAKQICEEIIDQFSSELHNYYTYELKLSNYAGRHAKLIRLISCAHQVLISIKDYMTMAKIFDIFVVDIYESELYE